MFVLRIIEETRKSTNEAFDQVITNYEVGKSYSVLKSRVTTEFDEIMKDFPDAIKEDVSAVICTEKRFEDNNVFFIIKPTELKQYSYFIMTDNGKTFEKL